ncbi:MAG: glycosyltransferase family 4 protein [Candidatus Peribacteraceae bacterium]|nr:glycosyltransferase family 4 protein [Candidatus Peribacteraceae bacterium]
MRILFTRFPLESRYGGAEVQTLSLMQGLRSRGHAVAFLGSCPTLLDLCRKEGLPAAELSIGVPPVTKWGVALFFLRKKQMERKLAAALAELSDLKAICMLSLSEKLLLTPLARAHGIRILWIEHDGVGRWLTKNPWLPRLRELSQDVTTVVVSDLSRDLYLALGWDPAHVVSIPNGIDAERLVPTPYALSPTPQRTNLRLGCIARLTEDKGVDVLIDAVSDLPEVTLTIVGRGREEGYLHKIVFERRLSDRVSFVQDIPDIGTFYRSLDLFVLPSRTHDPFGLAAAEAMLLGIPAIVTDACGIARHVAAGKEALVVRADDAGALRDAIRSLFPREQRLALGHAGKCAALEKFTLERMTNAYEALLRG